MKDPLAGCQVRGDRLYGPARRAFTPMVALAFRVHFRVDALGDHRVSEPMFECDAVDFANKIEQTSGMSLLPTPDRPRGIESILGYDDRITSRVPEAFAWWRKKVLQHRQSLDSIGSDGPDAAKTELEKYKSLLEFLERAPESIRAELLEFALSADSSERE